MVDRIQGLGANRGELRVRKVDEDVLELCELFVEKCLLKEGLIDILRL